MTETRRDPLDLTPVAAAVWNAGRHIQEWVNRGHPLDHRARGLMAIDELTEAVGLLRETAAAVQSELDRETGYHATFVDRLHREVRAARAWNAPTPAERRAMMRLVPSPRPSGPERGGAA